ncbi:MAG: dgoA [Acidimicrobiaceae bacterium]|nr:dgoA [Acidimicrobiaceae bacterium]
MKIVAVETIRVEEFPEFTAVRVHTDEGVTGLGETCFGPEAVEAYLHESVAGRIIGKDPLAIERHAHDLPGFYVTHGGTGVSTRAHSAIDIALWDLLGKVSGQPLYQLLGGAYRESAPIYNTCGGYRYGRKEAKFRGTSRPDDVADEPEEAAPGPYEDLVAFQTHADELALSLLSEGITGMKIWPFDEAARASEGKEISRADLKRALEPFEKIRSAVGDRMEIMVELHGLWDVVPAIQICRALEDFRPYWVEDPIELDSDDALRRLKASTNVQFALGETLGSLPYYKRLFDTNCADIVMFDFGWGSGISEGRKVAALAQAYGLPIAPHDCVGPVALCVGAHFSVATPNVLIQETVRAYYTDWYRKVLTELPTIANGRIAPSSKPGIGVELLPGLESRPDAHVRISR